MEVSIILTGIFFLALLILGHELGHFFAAKLFGLRVDEFGIGFPPRIASKNIGETKYSINLLPFGGFVRIHGEHADDKKPKDPKRSFLNQNATKRSIIVIAGVLMNFLIGWIAFSVVFASGIPAKLAIEQVSPGSPAEAAGFEVGEYIAGFSSTEEFIGFINSHGGEEITINERRITPRVDPPEGEGGLGVTVVEVGIEKQGVLKSVVSGLKSAVEVTSLIIAAFFGFFKGIFVGDFAIVNQISGPVGVFNILGETSRLGAVYLIQFLGLISLNLVVINMIPLPALDGGRFLFILVEKVIGRRLNSKFEAVANAVGVSLLLLLMVIVTIRDIMRIL